MKNAIFLSIIGGLTTIVLGLVTFIYLKDTSSMSDIAKSSASSATVLGVLSSKMDTVTDRQAKLIEVAEQQTKAISVNTLKYAELKEKIQDISLNMDIITYNVNLVCNYEQHKWPEHSRCKQ